MGVGVGVGLGLSLSLGLGLTDDDGSGLVLDDAPGESLGVVDVESLGSAVGVGWAVVGLVVGVGLVESVGELLSLGLAALPESVNAELRTAEDEGGEPQTALAVAAGELAAMVAPISNAAPKDPSPMAAPSAVGLASSALTPCTLALVSLSGLAVAHHSCSPHITCGSLSFLLRHLIAT